MPRGETAAPPLAMNNIVGYAQSFLAPFEDAPFTEVDSLVLSELAYLRYEHCGLEKDGRILQLGVLSGELSNQQLLSHVYAKSMMRELMHACALSPRFRWLAATKYTNHVDAEVEKQFSATTYLFEDGTVYVAFRGTDSTLVGWRENFNMTILPVVPSQESSVAYLQSIADTYQGPIYVGGHSKGGNLAVYAAACCRPDIQDRILAIYSHDGPGFHPEFFEHEGYHRIQGRIHKMMPESAIIGLLLQHQEPYTVIESTEHGIYQHSGLSWVVVDGKFSVKDSLNKQAQNFTTSLNQWTDTLDVAQRKALIDTLFRIISVTQAQTLSDLAYATVRHAPAVAKAISGIDPETKQLFLGKMNELTALLGQPKEPPEAKEPEPPAP